MKYINFTREKSDLNENDLKARNLSLEAALDSIIMLKNDNALPIKEKAIDVFGNGVKHTIKGGLGSGEVIELNYTNIYDALINEGFIINSNSWLNRYENLYNIELKKYKRRVHKAIYHFNFINFMGERINLIPGDLINSSDIKSKTCIYIISRYSGEGKDISKEEYSISDIEYKNILFASKKYEKVILVLNVGGFFDLSFIDEIDNIDGILYMGNLGYIGSIALAKILNGISPSGALPFTYPNKYQDIPYSKEFSYNSNSIESNYKEGIYVGYRYYDTFKKDVRYPFGYGLSYSNFSVDNFSYEINNSIFNISFDVKNIGDYKAKKTIMLFLSSPKVIGEEKSLVGFNKTKELAPSEVVRLSIKFDLFDFSYNYKNKELLSKGVYIIRYGNNVLDTYPIYKFKLDNDLIINENKSLSNFKDELVKKINPLDLDVEEIKINLNYIKKSFNLNNDFSLISNLSLDDKIKLCIGSGLKPKSNHILIPGVAGFTSPYINNMISLAMADGPAGIRVSPKVKLKKNGKLKAITPAMDVYNYLPKIIKKLAYAKENSKNVRYQYSTSFPTGISMASTFNLDLINRIGKTISSELSNLGISFYLAPAVNIIKNPIGGRSYEYYSEDPYLSGIVASSLIKGIEANNSAYATIKHFSCNNLEFMRNVISANVSSGALRDIYFKPFKLAIKYSNVKCIMSSYNKINHKYVCNDDVLLNDILRCEYGFNGLIMTDWLSTAKKYASPILAIKSGNDLIMPGSKNTFKMVKKAYKKGIINDLELNRAAYNVYKLIVNSEVYKQYNFK